MALDTRNISTHSLLDLEAGEISREVFVNEDVYQQELEQIYVRAIA